MANGFTTDILGAVERGQQFRQAQALRPIEQQAAQLGLQQQQQQLASGGLQNQLREQQITTGGLNQQLLKQTFDQRTDDQKNLSFVTAAMELDAVPDEGKVAFIKNNIAKIQAQGGDPADSIKALELAENGDFEQLNASLKSVQEMAVRQGIIKAAPTAKQASADFTLSPGQQRFGAGGELITEVAASTKGTLAEEVPDIPKVLLKGIEPELAIKGAAAFKAAGGGKDGMKAFQKTIDKGSEQQRRLASPAILKSSFPLASQAETVQLQAAMDAAKNTESGLKEAGKVRTEQRRMKKAKAFQGRIIELLDNILGSDELEDVIGSIEGGIDFRLFSDEESQIIADIEEAGNILTSDNLDLMTGVLSETDIKIIASLSGGALNRRRSEGRFRGDVTKLRDRLASKLALTADDIAAERESLNQNPTVPPSGRQGGTLHTDAQGNRAFVFEDGSFEEI